MQECDLAGIFVKSCATRTLDDRGVLIGVKAMDEADQNTTPLCRQDVYFRRAPIISGRDA
jgi:hypothetical protein